jgi:hypothetical protein
LSGEVEQLAKGGEHQGLSASASWQVNGIDRTEAVLDGHFARVESGYVLDLLGKNGEPLADRQVVFVFKHKRFENTVSAALRSDARGRVVLGPLEQIQWLTVTLPDGRNRHWSVDDFARTTDDTIQVAAGAAFEVPLRTLLVPGRFALLEIRNGIYVVDATNRIELPPMGPYIEDKNGKSVPGVRLPFIPVSGLTPGDYRLLLPDENRSVDVKVSKGTVAAGWVYGSGRALQLSQMKPLNIARIDAGPAEVVVTVTNTNPFTRVHIAATRYIDNETRLATLMAFSRLGGASEVPARLPNLYSAGRDIGDEYRYILERRYSQKFAGNMLSRPGLILNPLGKAKDRPGGARPESHGAGRGDRGRTRPPGHGTQGTDARAGTCGSCATPCVASSSQPGLSRRHGTRNLQLASRQRRCGAGRSQAAWRSSNSCRSTSRICRMQSGRRCRCRIPRRS